MRANARKLRCDNPVAFAASGVENAQGKWVILLAYLVPMNRDSSRGVGRGDLSGMLEHPGPTASESVVQRARRHDDDDHIVENVWEYVELGRWEDETSPNPAD